MEDNPGGLSGYLIKLSAGQSETGQEADKEEVKSQSDKAKNGLSAR
jgi:hypothetical protein